MCQGNGEVTAAHPFCVILQKDRLYFKGTDRAVFLDKREFTGPIYTQIKEAVDFVLRNIRLGATIDGLVRKEKYELPPEAIREMIINAHCHRNLLDESCIQVAVYDDRLEVTSPGGLYNGLTYEEVMNCLLYTSRFINHNIIHVILNIFQIMLLCKIHQIITDLFCIS